MSNDIQYVICNFPCASINVSGFQNVPFLTPQLFEFGKWHDDYCRKMLLVELIIITQWF
jgi:hypothetical protein